MKITEELKAEGAKARDAALAEVNKGKATMAAWAAAHRGWLIAVAAAFMLGFIIAKLA